MADFIIKNNFPDAQYNLQKTAGNSPAFGSGESSGSAAVLPPKGKLVEDHLINDKIYKQYADSAKTFYKAAVKGEGTDYSVGNINDSAIRLASLAIAGLFAAKSTSGGGKLMEFVGLGTWFGAMAIWPKFFIGKPIKALTGVDVNQEYVDSFGRRKRFFEDPQYLPWDLWTDEQINKIGDKLKIPKDIQNRREAVQDKMKQIATQSNTLWMLTAGAATPILSSLIADQLKAPAMTSMEWVKTGLAKRALNQAKATVSQACATSHIDKSLEKLLAGNLDQAKITEFFENKFKSSDIIDSVKDSLGKIFESGGQNVPKGIAELHSEASRFIKTEKAWNRFCKATLGNNEGSGLANEWGWQAGSAQRSIYNALGIPKKLAERIVSCGDEVERAKMIAAHLHSLTPSQLDKAMKEIGTAAGKAISNAGEAEKTLAEFSKSVGKSSQFTILKDAVAKIIENKLVAASDRVANATTSFFGIHNVVNTAKMNPAAKALTEEVLKGVTSGTATNKLSAAASEGNLTSELGKFFGYLNDSKNEILKKVKGTEIYNKIESAIISFTSNGEQSNLGRLGEWLGKTPKNFIVDAAKEKLTYGSWLKNVGLLGAATVAGSLILMSMFGKKNKYNTDLYDIKRGAANENSK